MSEAIEEGEVGVKEGAGSKGINVPPKPDFIYGFGFEWQEGNPNLFGFSRVMLDNGSDGISFYPDQKDPLSFVNVTNLKNLDQYSPKGISLRSFDAKVQVSANGLSTTYEYSFLLSWQSYDNYQAVKKEKIPFAATYVCTAYEDDDEGGEHSAGAGGGYISDMHEK